MANPFYQPVQNQVAPALQGLSQSIIGVKQGLEQKRQYDEQVQKEQILKDEHDSAVTDFLDAVESHDSDKVNEYTIKYPKIAEAYHASVGIQKQNQKDEANESLQRILTGSDPIEELTSRIERLKSEGRDPTDSQRLLDLYETDPDLAKKEAELAYAFGADSDKWKRYRELTKEKPVEYKNVTKEPDGSFVGLNSATGKIETIPGDYELQPKETKRKLKEVKGGVKYFDDGSESPVGGNESVKNPVTGKRFNPQQAQAVLADAKEFQLKAGGYALTLDDGISNTDKMLKEGYDPTKATWIQSVFGEDTLPARTAMSEQDQIFFGSVEQMINAIARRETGAAITADEVKKFYNRYMPRSGDKPARVKQKQEALRRQLKSIAGQSAGTYEALKVTGDDANLLKGDPRRTPEQKQTELEPPELLKIRDNNQPAQGQPFTSKSGITFTVR